MKRMSSQKYQGSLTLPGEQDTRNVSVDLDVEGGKVRVSFDEPIEGSADWDGTSVMVAKRMKYDEVICITTGLPKETVNLTWKFNASLLDESLAGVVIAKPNALRITGERGFVLSKS